MGMKKKGSSLGMLFWLAVVLLTVAVFLYNRRNIENVLVSTGLLEQLRNRFGRSDETIELVYNAPQAQPGAPRALLFDDALSQAAPARGESEEPELVVTPQAEPGATRSDEQPADRAAEQALPEQSTTEQPTTERPPVEREPTLTTGVYFIRVESDGSILPVAVDRTLGGRSPMRHTIEALLRGPTIEELDAGLLNLIPQDTELLSATIQGGIVYLDFNEAFRFNPLGAEGTLAQLQQIVYSATNFDSVRAVQILIEGTKEDYLGSESLFIGVPLNRSSFG